MVGRIHAPSGARSVTAHQLASLSLIASTAEEEPDLVAALGVGVGLVPHAMSAVMTRSGSANVELIPVEPAVPLPPLLLSVRADRANPAVDALLEVGPELSRLIRTLRPARSTR